MQIKPRQNLLEVWQAIARHSFDNGEWQWGEWGGRSSVADAERLLCLLYPATEIEPFRLDDPDTTQLDVERALRNAGDSSEIPMNLLEILGDFMENHRGEESPTFAGGYYFAPENPEHELSKEQEEVGVVDSYSMSITLCLATLGFLKVYRGKTQRASTLARIDKLREATSARLTAAMVSLLRSFTVNVVDIASDQGQALARLLGRGGCPTGRSCNASRTGSSRCAPSSARASPSAWTPMSPTNSATRTGCSSAAGPGAW